MRNARLCEYLPCLSLFDSFEIALECWAIPDITRHGLYKLKPNENWRFSNRVFNITLLYLMLIYFILFCHLFSCNYSIWTCTYHLIWLIVRYSSRNTSSSAMNVSQDWAGVETRPLAAFLGPMRLTGMVPRDLWIWSYEGAPADQPLQVETPKEEEKAKTVPDSVLCCYALLYCYLAIICWYMLLQFWWEHGQHGQSASLLSLLPRPNQNKRPRQSISWDWETRV